MINTKKRAFTWTNTGGYSHNLIDDGEDRPGKIPKSQGGYRLLGIPTVVDRCIQQALLQVLQPEWDRTFSDSSYGFRTRLSAHNCNIYVKSARSGRRVMAGITEYLKRKLKLTVNEAKSAVDRPWKRAFPGFTFTRRRPNRRKTSNKALNHFMEEIRRITGRIHGVTIVKVIKDLKSYLTGWKLYFSFSEAKSVFQGLGLMSRKMPVFEATNWST